ncbi:hypothetical protein KIS1582_1369 [Cytobacillus firmus]|uniref:Uncharacterized protein n=1 Tax=Cytobacillus firmus TaxID=1399 RepID=A0A800MYJ7_CYTFI|nr:hypothetical protein KIS1582_1369 [Cytobacillus firmus]
MSIFLKNHYHFLNQFACSSICKKGMSVSTSPVILFILISSP